jgi:hypothetical protein
MRDLHTLRDLHRRLREATGSDTDLDTAIADALEPGRYDYALIPEVTGSIEDALDLIERMLPDRAYLAGKGRETATESLYGVIIYHGLSAGSGELGVGEHATHHGIAACLALVSALIAIDEEKERGDG